MSEDKKHTRHLTHALIMVVLWIPVLMVELYLLQDSTAPEGGLQKPENTGLILLVLGVSIALIAGVLWKMFLYLRGSK